MKNFKLFKLLLLGVVLITSINTSWAGINVARNSHLDFYVDVSATSAQWQDHVALAFGNGSASIKVPGTHLNHTKLWYCYLYTDWTDLYWMAAYDADWKTGTAGNYSNYSNDIGAAWVSAQYMPASYNINANAVTLVCVGSAASHPALTLSTVNDNRDYAYMNYDINLESYVKVGAAAYSKANAKGAITAGSYRVYGGNTSTEATSASLSTSQNATTLRCARTAETSFSVATPASGYEFVGWFDGSGSKLSDATSYTTYNPTTEGAYVRAYFAQTHAVTVNAGVNGTVSTSGNKTIGQKGLSITASNTVDDYYFVGWVCTGGASVDDASAATTTIRATAAGTVTAKFVSKWAIRGSMSNDDLATYYDLTNKGSNTWSGNIHLSANSVYTFKVYDNPSGATWGYGSTDSYRRSYVGQTAAWGLSSGEKELIIMTANEGDYTFSWNSSSKQLTVLYPEITHPNSNYVYFKNKPAGWSTVTAHIWGDGSVPSTGWDALPVLSTFSFDGDNYYYMALGSHTTGLVSDGSDGSDAKKTADLSLSSHKGQWYDIATKSAQSSEVSSRWHDFTQDVTLILQNGGSDQTIVATYGAAMPTKLKDGSTSVSAPSFSGYEFEGYYKNSDGSGKQYYTKLCASANSWDQTGSSPSVYAKWTQTVTLTDVMDTPPSDYTSDGSTTATFNAGGPLAITAPTRVGCSVEGYYADKAFEHKVMEADGTLVNYTGYVTDGKWVHASATTLYTKWTSNNFVIYRSGDKDGDPRSLSDQVETYAGGTISKTIEYRMKVQEGLWYSLCLPFTVNAVKVWDEDDKAYYNITPYYRKVVGGTFYEGHYVLRTPSTTTDMEISNFSDWRDATYYDVLPAENTPYIILWHTSTGYFTGRYVSFFGASGQTIPTSMTAGTAPSDARYVNICVNDAMKSTNVAGAYTLVNDYGGGAWLQNDDASARTVLPFECYLLTKDGAAVSSPLRPRNAFDETNTATGWEDVIYGDKQEQITVYTITGALVGQYNNCSMNDVKGKLKAENKEGIFILRAGSESVKLMIGSK